MTDYPEWMAWRRHRKRQLMCLWTLAGFVAGGLIGQELPERGWAVAVAGALFGSQLVYIKLTLLPYLGIPRGWPGWRCIVAQVEGKVPDNRYGCWNGLHGLYYAQPATGPCWCKRAERLEARIDLGLEGGDATFITLPPKEQDYAD